MVAAATIVAPRARRAGRNYDYRYAWIRDQCYAGQAAAVGRRATTCSTPPSVRRRARRARRRRRAAPGLHRRRRSGARRSATLPLPGYPGAPTSRSATGPASSSSSTCSARCCCCSRRRPTRDRLDADGWHGGAGRADAIARAAAASPTPASGRPSRRVRAQPADLRRRAAPDRGRRAARTADRRSGPRSPTRSLADTAATCLHPTGRWQRAPDDDRVDAALLLPQHPRRCCPPTTRAPRDAARRARRADAGRLRLPLPVTTGRSATPRARSCSAGSGWRMALRRRRAIVHARRRCSSAPGPAADRPGCSPRSTTSPSASCAATSRRRSYTPPCSRRPASWPDTSQADAPTGLVALAVLLGEEAFQLGCQLIGTRQRP